jgi:hypothetical protein
MRKSVLPYCVTVLVAFAIASGCKTGPSPEELKKAESEQQFAQIKQTYDLLQQQRGELATANATIAEIESVAERKRGEEQKAQLEELQARVPVLTAEIDSNYEKVQEAIATFLNTALNEFPSEQITSDALRIYSDEAIIVATDMVDKIGDYSKAVDHLQAARGYYEAAGLTPYQPLLAKIANLEDWKFITEERFKELKKNMTRDEVKATLGVPYYQNVQTDEKRGVETWLYKRREGGAAAVYFKISTGKLYQWKFDAVKPKVAAD